MASGLVNFQKMLNQAYAEIVRTARTLANARVRGGKACGDGFIAGDLKCHVGAGAGNQGDIGKIPKFGRKHYAKVGGRLQRVADVEKPNPMSAEWPPRRALPGRPDTAPPPQAARPAIQRPAPLPVPSPEDARRAVIVAEHNARAAEANAQAVRDAKIAADIARQAAVQPPAAGPLRGQAAIIARQAAAQHLPPRAPVIRPQAHAPIGRAGIAAINQAIYRNDVAAVRGVNLNGAAPRIKRWQQDVIAHMERNSMRPVAPVAQAAPAAQPIAPVTPGNFQSNIHAEQQKVAGDIATSTTRKLDKLGGRQNYSQSFILKATAADGTVTKGVFKPESGEGKGARSNIDDRAVSGAKREVASYDIAKQLGIEHSITAMVIVDGKKGSLQSLIDFDPDSVPTKNAYGDEVRAKKFWPKLWDNDKSRLAELAVLDYITGNTDRHSGNMMVDKVGRLHPIDHGLTLPESHHTYEHTGLVGGNVSTAMVFAHEVQMDAAADRRVSELSRKVNSPEFATWLDTFGATHGLLPGSVSTMKQRAANLQPMLHASGGANPTFFKAMRKSAHGTKDADNFLARLRAP